MARKGGRVDLGPISATPPDWWVRMVERYILGRVTTEKYVSVEPNLKSP